MEREQAMAAEVVRAANAVRMYNDAASYHAYALALHEHAADGLIEPSSSRSKLSPAPSSSSYKSCVELLRDARAQYDAALARLSTASSSAFRVLYNAAVCLSDLARATDEPSERSECLRAAAEQYRLAAEAADVHAASASAPSVCSNSGTPASQQAPSVYSKALNNRGLSFQQAVSEDVPSYARFSPHEQLAQLHAAAACFRDAVRSDPLFHRAAYNLGTVCFSIAEVHRMYGHTMLENSCEMHPTKIENRCHRPSTDLGSGRMHRSVRNNMLTFDSPQSSPADAYRSLSAAFVALACATAPSADGVYKRSLQLVWNYLPAEHCLYKGLGLAEFVQESTLSWSHLSHGSALNTWSEVYVTVTPHNLRVCSIPSKEMYWLVSQNQGSENWFSEEAVDLASIESAESIGDASLPTKFAVLLNCTDGSSLYLCTNSAMAMDALSTIVLISSTLRKNGGSCNLRSLLEDSDSQ